MARREDYRRELESIDEQEWEPYLLDWSGLPGPRGNLGLAQAVADLAPPERLRGWAAIAAREAPTGSREEFLAFCGTVGLGRPGHRGRHGRARPAASRGERPALASPGGGRDGAAAHRPGRLRRARGNARGLGLRDAAGVRAVVAALCEPALLTEAARAKRVLDALDAITAGFTQLADRRGADVRALRQTLGYGWSVAVAALPAEHGLPVQVHTSAPRQARASRPGAC